MKRKVKGKSKTKSKPYWTTSDGKAVKLYQGHVLDVLKRLPARSVQTVVTSPPYWGLRDYGTAEWEGGDPECDHRLRHGKVQGNPEFNKDRPSRELTTIGNDYAKEICPKCGAKRIDQQLGSEKTPEEYVAKMVEVFAEVRRVLRDDGTVWLNLGDTYYGKRGLAGIPWRVALALQADGWILRQDIIWCLSGATWVYVRSQKGDMPMTIKDLARLDPSTVKMWDGKEWVQLLGVSRTPRDGREVKLTLRSGETINCSDGHRFPTKNRGLVKAKDLSIGDCLTQTTLPEPDDLKSPIHIGVDAAWLAGVYLAEGCGAENSHSAKFGLAGHRKEFARWNRVLKIARSYGGHATLRIEGNNQTISVHGKVITSIIRELIVGKTSKGKHFSPSVWKYSNQFLQSLMEGYLHGDGGDDKGNRRVRLGFTRNHGLARDIRTACARLGWVLTLKPCMGMFDGREFPGFRGEIRKIRSGHLNEKDRCEITAICASHAGPGKFIYDVGVDGNSHLFTLASGVVTHNSKPSPMPESVKNRCTKAHEYLFLLAKRGGYYYDAEAIKERGTGRRCNEFRRGVYVNNETYDNSGTLAGSQGEYVDTSGANKRSVWTIPPYAYSGAHFATFPPRLVIPCVRAGTSEMGCCLRCGAPRKRLTEEKQLKRKRPNDYVKRKPRKDDAIDIPGSPMYRGGSHNSGLANMSTCANSVAGVSVKTVGWEATCDCGVAKSIPCTVLDPFVGSGTTCCVAIAEGRRSIGIDLSEEYLMNQAIPRINGTLMDRPKLATLANNL